MKNDDAPGSPTIDDLGTNQLGTPPEHVIGGSIPEFFNSLLDGPDAASAEGLKGSDAFDRTLAGIRNLVKSGISVTASSVLTSKNSSFDQLRCYVELMESLGVNHISFIQYYPVGSHALSADMLTAEENKIIAARLTGIEREFLGVDIEFENSFGFLATEAPRNYRRSVATGHVGCECGKSRISVYPNGDVIPCDFLAGHDDWTCGNIFEQDIQDIWIDAAPLQKLRGRQCDNCQECSHLAICGGGCPAMAYLTRGSINSPDPRCPRVQEMASP